jgi:hypothetical protein
MKAKVVICLKESTVGLVGTEPVFGLMALYEVAEHPSDRAPYCFQNTGNTAHFHALSWPQNSKIGSKLPYKLKIKVLCVLQIFVIMS